MKKSVTILAATLMCLFAAVLAGGDKASSSNLFPTHCLDQKNISRWTVEFPPKEDKGFEILQEDGNNILQISLGKLIPEKSTVRILLPGDGKKNGNIWARNNASFLTFRCKSNEPVKMTCHLLHRGKSAGMYQTAFSVEPGKWQRIILPVQNFRHVRDFRNTAGIGFRAAKGSELQQNARVSIADIKVGKSPYSAKALKKHQRSMQLSEEWKFRTDPENKGIDSRWFADGFDDSNWQSLKANALWRDSSIDYCGDAWYRQKVTIPADWKDQPVIIDFGERGKPKNNGNYDRYDDRVYVNGHCVGGFDGEYKFKALLKRSYAIPAKLLRPGQENTIAIRVTAPANQGYLSSNKLKLETCPYGVMIRPQGSSRAAEIPASFFDITDCQNGAPIDLTLRLPEGDSIPKGSSLNYKISDTFGSLVKSGTSLVETGNNNDLVVVIPLAGKESVQLYLSSRGKINATLADPGNTTVITYDDTFGPFNTRKRDTKQLPALPEKYEETAYGKLKLIDEIDCTIPIDQDPHPYVASSFDHKIKFQVPGAPGKIETKTILGRKCKTVADGFFGYRIGRGKLKPHQGYIIRVEYPEDIPRIACITINNHHSYVDVGWKNGVSPDDPMDNYPLTQSWQNFDVFTVLDNFTYGSGGTGSAPSEFGIWVFALDKGRKALPQYQGGPAIAKIKLYEADPIKNAPQIRLPEGSPQRTLMVDWERQPNEIPEDMVKYCRFMGYNAVSPLILKWVTDLYAPALPGYSGHYFMPRSRNRSRVNYQGEGKDQPPALAKQQQTVHENYLDATKKYGVKYIPRLEYGGSHELPTEARAIGPNGKLDPAGRYCSWGANLLHPATMTDMKNLLEAVIGKYKGDNPQLAGFLWRVRCGRMQLSYGKQDVEMFCQETGTPMPDLKGKLLSKWASENRAYHDWWDKKRSEFHQHVRDILATYDPNMKLLINLWDSDKWSLGLPGWFTGGNWSELSKYPLDERDDYYRLYTGKRKQIKPEEYARMIKTGDNKLKRYAFKPHERLLNELYKSNSRNIWFFAPANYPFLSDNEAYLEAFRTEQGLAMANMITYDEHSGRYISPKYETSMIVPASSPFSMANEILACYNSDPDIISYTSYTFGRAFPDAHRRFAQAYLALPGVRGKIIADAVVPADKDIRVRTYATDHGTYVGIVSKKYTAAEFTVSIPGNWQAGTTVLDQVTGKSVSVQVADGKLTFKVKSGAMQLNSFLIK